jgi:type VI protein secretion system component VasF
VAEVEDRPVESAAPRRRVPVWVALAVIAVVALGAWALVALLDDGDDGEANWEDCAERVDPPAARSERLREFREAEDVGAARDRLAQEIRRVERRLDAECGERP